jgi:hypothetical protein
MRTLPFVALAGLALLGALGCGPAVTVTMHEIAPTRAAVPRAAEGVVVYQDVLPPRPFVTHYVMDLSPPSPTTPAVLVRYRNTAAQAGCDAVIVYTEENALVKAGPRSDDESLVIGADGALASRAVGVGVSNRRAFHVEQPKRALIIDAPSVGLCITFNGPPG